MPYVFLHLSTDNDYWNPVTPFPVIATTDNDLVGTLGVNYDKTLAATGKAPFVWSLEAGALPDGLSFASNGRISGTPTTAGSFPVIVKASNSAGSDTKTLSIVINDVGINEPISARIKTYPNPTNDQVRINFTNGGTAEISFVNTIGQVVKVVTLDEISNIVDISTLNAGVYMLKVSQGGSVYTTKIVKK
jgi:hypothetical protein